MPSKFSVTRTSSVKARPPLFPVTQETLKWAIANSSFPPTLKEQHCGFFYVPQESEQWKNCETGPIEGLFQLLTERLKKHGEKSRGRSPRTDQTSKS